jgi:DNA-binding NarL/FixJ family response regulator
MAPIRTVTINLSTLLGEIVEQLVSTRVQLEVVARLHDYADLCEELRLLAPGLILIGLRPNEADAIAASILTCLPTARIIVFTADRRHAYVHEMRPHRVALFDVTPTALIDAIVRDLDGNTI